MSDVLIDTNVLLVASAAHPFSPFADSDVPAPLQLVVFEWLSAFRADPGRRLVIDDAWKIYEEYRNKLSEQDFGLQVVHLKLSEFALRSVSVSYDEDGIAKVPKPFSSFDKSDRKFVAALISAGEGATLINATDTDWIEIENVLVEEELEVEHILEDWLRAKHFAKASK